MTTTDIYICDSCGTAYCESCQPRSCPHERPLCDECWHTCGECRREAHDEGSAA